MTFNTTTDPFNIYWLVKLIEQKVQSAKEEINQIRIGNLQFLNKNPSENNRTRKAAPIVAEAAIAGIRFFVFEILMENSCSRGTMYTFESRQDQARAITKNIEDSEEYSMALTDYVLKIVTSSNDKFLRSPMNWQKSNRYKNKRLRTRTKSGMSSGTIRRNLRKFPNTKRQYTDLLRKSAL